MSQSADEQSRKNEAQILKALASVGQKTVADSLSLHESTVSRMKDGEITRISIMLSSLGLKVVPKHLQCYKPESIQAMITLANERMAQIRNPEQLVWEE